MLRKQKVKFSDSRLLGNALLNQHIFRVATLTRKWLRSGSRPLNASYLTDWIWQLRSIFWDVYVAIIYGILYLCFVAYPIVFTSAGISGLAFTGLAVGSFLVIGTEPLLRKMINSHKKDPETGKVPPEAMVSIVCIAAVLVPVGELWFAVSYLFRSIIPLFIIFWGP